MKTAVITLIGVNSSGHRKNARLILRQRRTRMTEVINVKILYLVLKKVMPIEYEKCIDSKL